MIRSVLVSLCLGCPLASAGVVYDLTTHRLDYVTTDYGDQAFLPIDVDGDGLEEFSFTILNDDDEHYLGALDFSRNHGFVGDFDDDSNFVFRVFEQGDTVGPDLEDDLGFELRAHAAYEFDRGTPFQTSGGGLASSTIYVGFGFYAVGLGIDMEDEGYLYGWMRVTFGELVATEPFAPSNTFIEITQIAYADSLGSGLIVGIPCNAADLALPYDVLDLTDIGAFVGAFTAAEPLADLDGNGVYDLSDISLFVDAFNAGCP